MRSWNCHPQHDGAGFDRLDLNLIINYHPPEECVSHWTPNSLGYETTGTAAAPCLDEIVAHLDHPYVVWELISASNEEHFPELPKVDLSTSLKNMLAFSEYRRLATTVQVLHGLSPRSIPLGDLVLAGTPFQPSNTAELLVIDPLEVRDEVGAVFLRTRIQLRSEKCFFLGIGTRQGARLRILAATFRQVQRG